MGLSSFCCCRSKQLIVVVEASSCSSSSIIVVVAIELSSFCSSSSVVVMTMVWWDIENVPPPTYALLECSYVLLEHILAFHGEENLGLNLGLFSVQMLVRVLAYGCLEGLTKAFYIPITQLGICVQHSCCTSSSFGKKQLDLEYIVSFDG